MSKSRSVGATLQLDYLLKHYVGVYNGLADHYDAARFDSPFGHYDLQESRAVLKDIVRRFAPDPAPDWRALDVATGTGKAAIAIAELGRSVVALDAAEAMLQDCAANVERARLRNVEFVLGDAGHLPFPEDCFDMVASFRFLHLFPTSMYPALIGEMARVTRHGGRIVVEFKNANYGGVVHPVKAALRRRAGDKQTTYATTQREVRRLARDLRLQVELIAGVGLPKAWWARNHPLVSSALRRMARGPLRPISNALVAVLRKDPQ